MARTQTATPNPYADLAEIAPALARPTYPCLVADGAQWYAARPKDVIAAERLREAERFARLRAAGQDTGIRRRPKGVPVAPVA